MTTWTPFTVAVVTNALPTALAESYASWLAAHPEKANRLVEIVEEIRRAFRDAVSTNPQNLMDTETDTLPNVGFRHAMDLLIYTLGREVGADVGADAYSQAMRADVWLRMVQDGGIPIPCDPELRGGTPSYKAPGEMEARPARVVLEGVA